MYPFLSDIKQRAFAQSAVKISSRDLKFVKELGKGVAGKAKLYELVGSNEEIKPYAANGRVVLKSYVKDVGVDWKEVTNVQYLKMCESIGPCDFYPKQAAILMNNKVKIISEWVSYGDNQSSDLEKFTQNLGNNLNFYPFDVAALAAQVFFHDMSKAIVENVYFMHQKGLIYFDMAARNVIVAAPEVGDGLKFKAQNTDFGLSCPISKEDGTYTFCYERKNDPKLPYVSSSGEITRSAALSEMPTFGKRTVSPFTDIFARKATIIEMLGCFMGQPGEKTLFISGALDPQQKIECRKTMTDEEVLCIYFANAKSCALKLMKRYGVYDGRGEVVLTFLNRLEMYLTSMPDRSLPYLEASKNDYDLFMKYYAGYEGLQKEYSVNCKPVDLANKIMPGMFVSHVNGVPYDESADEAACYNNVTDDEMSEVATNSSFYNEEEFPPFDIEGEREFPLFRVDADNGRSPWDSLRSSRDSLRGSRDSLRNSRNSLYSSRDSLRSSQGSIFGGSTDGYATDKESGQSPQVSPYASHLLFKPQGNGYAQDENECTSTAAPRYDF